MKNLIYLPFWIETLTLLQEGYNTNQISNKLNITYSHIHHIKNEFIKKKWIVFGEKQGRENTFIWTQTGFQMYVVCNNLLNKVKR